jgi:hypothetical protein
VCCFYFRFPLSAIRLIGNASPFAPPVTIAPCTPQSLLLAFLVFRPCLTYYSSLPITYYLLPRTCLVPSALLLLLLPAAALATTQHWPLGCSGCTPPPDTATPSSAFDCPRPSASPAAPALSPVPSPAPHASPQQGFQRPAARRGLRPSRRAFPGTPSG